ncbi:cyclic nucleotide-binding domain-containing protein [Desulforhopalus sp. IMCC35007]|uniref:cyclic nucleotide-binding domain-containing protein n=1 Tax=Desulforhopalus sp. IMCC35007 TaxID=2569543 RepID=UPI0010AE2A7B|nr:cyclic nucleotide-binding domain-containing protein [Desulforhopalus sp. IMCC35007]TKB09644.1 cyclic nucleotide-binding domain-containing protein [Desulforhopalus sp. IMCC35007]
MKKDKYRDAVFVIMEECSCPIYDLGDELKVQNFSLVTSSYKASCLHLTAKIADIVTVEKNLSGSPQKTGGQKLQFDCGGCGESKIFFEYKKEKDFATLQMKMLKEAQEQRNSKQLKQHFEALRKLDIFKPLNDSSLIDLALLLEFKTIPQNKIIVKKGSPGNQLYIILKGKVAVTNSNNSKIAELKEGEIFGEMSLLSGEPVSSSIHTIEETQVATLSVKHFRNILKGYHILQFFLLKLLVDRSQTAALRTGNITSGMTGNLADINTADLFQAINLARKTGTVQLSLQDGKAVVFFREGDIVYARYAKYRQKEAVSALLNTKNGHFGYTRGIPKELEKALPIG